MQRVRQLDELSKPQAIGFFTNPITAYSKIISSMPVLGRRKITIDYPRPLRDYRYHMIPVLKVKTRKRVRYLPSTYKGKKPQKYSRRRTTRTTYVYTKYINLKRPKFGVDQSNGLVRLNPFQVAQVLGYDTRGVLTTPKTLPAGWSHWRLEGQFASVGMNDAYLSTFLGFLPFDLTTPLAMDMTTANLALSRALGEVSAPDVDFGEMVGELHQLVSLAEDPFKTLHKLAVKFQRYSAQDAWICKPSRLGNVAIRPIAGIISVAGSVLNGPLQIFSLRTRRKVGRAKLTFSAISEATSRWLQYRYGIAPLMKDVTTILEKFEEKYKSLLKIRTAKRTVVSTRKNKTWTWTTASAVSGFTITYRIRASVFDRTTAKVFYRLNLTDKYVNLRDLGLDSSNIIPLIHNLAPFSFVVDWFIGLESWYRSWNQDPSLVRIGNCVSRKRDTNVFIDIIKVTYNGYECPVPSSRYYFKKPELCRMVNLPEPLWPQFCPDFLKWRRVLDTFSLLWGKIPHK